MSQETVQTVTSAPVQVAQTPVETKGAVSESAFARSIASKQVAYAFQNTAAEPKAAPAPAEAPAQTTEEAPKAPESKATTEEVAPPAKEETAAEEEAAEVLSPETHSLDPKLQEILDKRIGKEVGKREKLKAKLQAAEAKAAELETKLAQQPVEVEKEVPVSVTANVPLPEIGSLEQLHTYKDNLQNDIIEAEMLLYSDFPAEGRQTKWGHVTKEMLIASLTEAKKIERTAIPAREKFLTTRAQSAQTAQEKFPFLKDPKHPGYQMAKQALKDNPVLRSYPNSDMMVGLMVKGQLAQQAEEAAKADPVKAVVKPRQKPTPGQSEIASDASIQRAPVGLMAQQALSAEIAKITGGKATQDAKSFAAVLAAKQRFRNSQ